MNVHVRVHSVEQFWVGELSSSFMFLSERESATADNGCRD